VIDRSLIVATNLLGVARLRSKNQLRLPRVVAEALGEPGHPAALSVESASARGHHGDQRPRSAASPAGP
jgi:hypothetical protein